MAFIFSQKEVYKNVKSYYEFCTFVGLHQLIKAPTRITCNSATIIDHILASYQGESYSRGQY